MIETDWGSFELQSNDKGIRLQLLRFKAHQRTDLQMLIDAVSRDDAVLDLGAHVGTYAIPLSRKAGSVVAVEADVARFKLLKRNIAANGCTNVTAVNCLVSPDSSRFSRMKERVTDAHKLDPLWVPAENGSGIGSVEGVPAAEILQRGEKPPTVIKSDLEGMDYIIISSIKDYVKDARPTLCCEFLTNSNESDQFEGLMSSLGYQMYVNIAPKNTSIFDPVPMRIDDLRSTPVKAILDIFAASAGSAQHAAWDRATATPDGQRLAKAFAAYFQNRYPRTLEILSQGAVDTANYHFLLARTALRTQNHAEATNACRRAIEIRGRSCEALSLLTECLIRIRDIAGAVENGEAAVAMNPNDPEGHFQLARAYQVAGDVDNAREHVGLAIGLDDTRAMFRNLEAALHKA